MTVQTTGISAEGPKPEMMRHPQGSPHPSFVYEVELTNEEGKRAGGGGGAGGEEVGQASASLQQEGWDAGDFHKRQN